MPPQAEKDVSIADIAAWLGVSEEEVNGIASPLAAPESGSLVGSSGLPESTVNDILAGFAGSRGAKPGAYILPDSMEGSPDRWLQALAEVYRHPCAYPAFLSPSQGLQLREWVLEQKPRNVLEIGCFMGASSLWMASALEELAGDGHLHSIDWFDPILPWPPHRYGYLGDPKKFAETSAAKAGLDHRITFHAMNSFDLVDQFDDLIGAPLDFTFIDGDHTVGGCLHDFITVAARTRIGGTLVLHDTNPEFCGWDGPRYVLDHLAIPSQNYEVEEVRTEPQNYGMAVIRKIGDARESNPTRALRLASVRWRSRLVRSPAWRSVRTTPLGKLIRRAVRR